MCCADGQVSNYRTETESQSQPEEVVCSSVRNACCSRMGKAHVSSVQATADNWKCVCSSNTSADPPTVCSSLDPNSSVDGETWSTGLAPPHSGHSPSAHSATSPFQLSASVQRSGPRLRLSPGHSQGPAGSPLLRLGSGPAARHAGRSVSP